MVNSFPWVIHFNKVTNGERGGDLDTLCEKIATIPDGDLWRHNQINDLPGEGEVVDTNGLNQIVQANKGKRDITYTHKHVLQSNLPAIRKANSSGFMVNLSANNLAHADKLSDTKAVPVVVILPENAPAMSFTPAGRKVVVCAAQQRKGVTCATCGFCQKLNRSVIIGFRAHGNRGLRQ